MQSLVCGGYTPRRFPLNVLTQLQAPPAQAPRRFVGLSPITTGQNTLARAREPVINKQNTRASHMLRLFYPFHRNNKQIQD